MKAESIFIIMFAVCGFIIAGQDFKERLVSLWIILLFMAGCIASVLYLNGIYALMANIVSVCLYFGLCMGFLFLYYYLKEKTLHNIIDKKIGKADLLIFLAIGITMELPELVFFFTGSFILSVLIGFIFLKQNKTIPLAGILNIVFVIYKTFEWNYFK